MRKLTILICLFFLLCSSAVSQAEEPDPETWTEGTRGKNGTVSYLYTPDLLKTYTVYRMHRGYKIVNVWGLFILPDGTKFKSKDQYYLNLN